MEKPAPADYPLHTLIERRWSPVAFSSRPIAVADICSLFEAARWAPSSNNEQPWFFMMATRDDAAGFERLLSCLTVKNQEWAKHAPLLILTFTRLAFERTGTPNRHAWHDVGLAVENLVLQAMSLGLFVHQMAGFDSEKVRTTFSVPGGVEPVTAIAVGYPGSTEGLSERLQRRESATRTRKPLSSILFTTAWGNNPGFLKK